MNISWSRKYLIFGTPLRVDGGGGVDNLFCCLEGLGGEIVLEGLGLSAWCVLLEENF
jgi:hypothetical protein